jgi:hypothetical protein
LRYKGKLEVPENQGARKKYVFGKYEVDNFAYYIMWNFMIYTGQLELL